MKRMYAVEYESADTSTFEIFEKLEQAIAFSKTVPTIFLWTADFSEELIWQEEDGRWNYDDVDGLFENDSRLTHECTQP